MSQKFSLYADLTAVENLRFFGGIYQLPRRELKQRIRICGLDGGLAGRENDLVGTLAGGWKQRLALGCAILHRPPILFLDEPTSGVDPQSRRRFWDLIQTLAAEGVSVLVSTHYMDEAEYCNRIALIDQGRLIALGGPAELKARSLDDDLLLIECDKLGAALTALHEIPDILDAAVFGSAIHVRVPHAELAETSLPMRLAAQGIAVERIERIEPSLEDVFVHLVAESAKARSRAS